MGNGYYDNKDMQRQRICYKCRSFVTHDKVDDKMVGCPLCGNRIEARPVSRVPRISERDMARMIAIQSKNRK